MEKLHLISNAHLDPVWQWQWQEGAGAAITTFSAAADFCEEFQDYVFCHNEAVLYQWVEEYDPALFARIQRLVAAGKWHIMGGWYLQPDCNMPSGESMIRQINAGLDYFSEKFPGYKRPEAAINFDSFGHTRGLVQILRDACYKGYVVMRPSTDAPDRTMVWRGFNGSEIPIYRIVYAYNTLLGQVDRRLEPYLTQMKHARTGMFLWGVGNHGGGPSRQDYAILQSMREKYPEIQFVHSTPEAFFEDAGAENSAFPDAGELNHVHMGCYSSMIRIKQLHQRLENELYSAEKMAVHAQSAGVPMDFDALKRAERDLLFCEFHDILPGTCIKSAEEDAVAMLNHGIVEAQQVKLKAFFALAGGQSRAESGEYPILVYNPHPFPVTRTVECEFMLADQNWSTEDFYGVEVYAGGKRIPAQLEKETSNIPLDWRKKVAFTLELPPFAMTRVSVFTRLEKAARQAAQMIGKDFTFDNGRLRATVSAATGMLERLSVDGKDYLLPGMSLEFIRYCCDPWGFSYDDYQERLGAFSPLEENDAARFASVAGRLCPMRVVERGEVRTVVESLLGYGDSRAALRMSFPAAGTEVELSLTLLNCEREVKLRLCLPTAVRNGKLWGRTAFGKNQLPTNGGEVVAQDYAVLADKERGISAVHFGNYGLSAENGTLRLTLLNSAAYTGHPIDDRKVMLQDRYADRIDMGERSFRFVLNFGGDRLDDVEAESAVLHQPPYALSYFPTGNGRAAGGFVRIDDPAVTLSACRPAKWGGLMFRLFNSREKQVSVRLAMDFCGESKTVSLRPYEYKTFVWREGGYWKECSCLEEEK